MLIVPNPNWYYLIWFDFEIDVEAGQSIVLQIKIDSLMEQIRRKRYCQEMLATALASVIEKITSLSLALGLLARMMILSMHAATSSWLH